jgi:hypothetical protein
LSKHEHFEQLCVLATSGQLSATESDMLSRHLVECDRCRSLLKDARFLSDLVIPQVLHVSRSDRRVPNDMRERFLARAAAEGLKIQAGPSLVTASSSDGDQQPQPAHTGSRRFTWPNIVPGSLCSWRVWATTATLCVACFVIGLRVETPFRSALLRDAIPSSEQDSAQQDPVHRLPPGAGLAKAGLDSNLERTRALSAEKDQLARQVAGLAQQVRSVEKESQQAALAMMQQLATAKFHAEQDHDALAQRVAELNTRAEDLQSQLDAARQQESLADADLRTARAKTVEYSTRVNLLQAQLQNQEAAALPNPNEVSNLVAARNLHIIDVYDSNLTGKRQVAFGRVFYVEGRSLVFYAYDLASARGQKNFTFHLWGEKVGSKETTLSLGILQSDDPQERRWALTCNNPNLLAKINSVYVTAESSDRERTSPHGARVLYAYFGSQPNHP